MRIFGLWLRSLIGPLFTIFVSTAAVIYGYQTQTNLMPYFPWLAVFGALGIVMVFVGSMMERYFGQGDLVRIFFSIFVGLKIFQYHADYGPRFETFKFVFTGDPWFDMARAEMTMPPDGSIALWLVMAVAGIIASSAVAYSNYEEREKKRLQAA